jgi:putative oxidoreductase
MDTGLLLLRIVVGLLFVGHGGLKLFGWLGGDGLDSTARYFDSLGYRPGRRYAIAGGAIELAGGALLALGLFTPIAAAVLIAMMGNAMAVVHWPKGLWNAAGGVELPLVLATVAAAVGFTGPGRYSVDRAFGWHLYGVAWGVVVLLVGAAGVAAGLAARAWATRDVEARRAHMI